ncbi:angiotensin-converting enzyme-like [Dermacentor silvarum]|uniref:angiotensin-converting enzyme-like n=1 Tax=Dermacentor silvarum TaxID=543639 RepID=UPI0021007A91|nr:angiotensin-converting enzyme-like [Dermacentor silvarum]
MQIASFTLGVVLFLERYAVAQCSPRRPVDGTVRDKDRAKAYLDEVDAILSDICYNDNVAEWNYETDINSENDRKRVEQSLKSNELKKELWRNITQFRWTSFKDPTTKRVFKLLSVVDTAILPQEKQNEFLKIVSDMQGNHASAKICPFSRKATNPDDCTLTLDKEIKDMLASSRNYDELLHVWNEWRRVSGKPVKEKFTRYVQLLNEAAKLNGFDDASGLWQNQYEYDGFEDNVKRLWEQLSPLYQQLHAYVRTRIRKMYGADKIREDGPIPAHLLGTIHSQQWGPLYKATQPFPNKDAIDGTSAMAKNNMSVVDMYKLAEEFFTSMGLPGMPKTFWERSLFVKPPDREIVCHASAWDFCNNDDVRIKQCAEVDMNDLLIIHHEMGHVEYYLKYAKQPMYFRDGANPGFHEAIGDTIALSVATPAHLKIIGLANADVEDEEIGLNYLYSTALNKVALLPSAYVYDLWRWNVFRGTYRPEEYNNAWWELLLKYQGICPGIARSTDDLDASSKYHISANVPYIRYFVSVILQFQFYKALCEEANHVGPLHRCDFYRSKEAGRLFGEVLALGKSKSWPEVLGLLTKGRTKEMDATPLLEYFQPLYRWLQKQNEGKPVGWRSDDATVCPHASDK